MASAESTSTQDTGKLPGNRSGAAWGALMGLILAVLAGFIGFSYLMTVHNAARQASVAEWGNAYPSKVTNPSELKPDTYNGPVREVTVHYAPDSPPVVRMVTEAVSDQPTINVWRNVLTGDVYVDGDIRHSYGNHEPYNPGDQTVIGLLTVLLVLGGFVVPFCVGIKRQNDYEAAVRSRREAREYAEARRYCSIRP